MIHKEPDHDLIELIRKRDGNSLSVKLLKGEILTVWNIAWGYDTGDEFAHITTNINPKVKDTTIDFFYSNEIIEVKDLRNGELIYKRQV